jgi:uncharacterized protein
MKMIKIKISILFIAMIFSHSLFANQFQVLVYTSPDRWHNPTIPVAMIEFQEMAKRHGFGLTWTQQPESFTDENLKRFQVIVFLHSTESALSAAQAESFRNYIRNGGGFAGIHGASIAADRPEWYKKLIGRVFTEHPEVQTAIMKVVDRNHPSTMHLPERWMWTDEWYAFSEPFVDKLNYLLTVDENTYDTDRTWGDDRSSAMGEFHPIAWYHEYDGGRSFFTSLGHMPELFKDPWFLNHIYGGIFWAATGLGIYK